MHACIADPHRSKKKNSSLRRTTLQTARDPSTNIASYTTSKYGGEIRTHTYLQTRSRSRHPDPTRTRPSSQEKETFPPISLSPKFPKRDVRQVPFVENKSQKEKKIVLPLLTAKNLKRRIASVHRLVRSSFSI